MADQSCHSAPGDGDSHDSGMQTRLLAELQRPQAYAHSITERIAVCETHISWVFLTGKFAYKVKKSLRNVFLDYSTLEKRQAACLEELRLDVRYAPQLYLGVVPIVDGTDGIRVEGSGKVIEYAVKMLQFSAAALMENELRQGTITATDVILLARHVADFHRTAARATHATPFGQPDGLLQEALDNFTEVESLDWSTEERQRIASLKHWTEAIWKKNASWLEHRKEQGFVRECHGDMHLGNIVRWKGELIPFDGIEFNESFRWIDVLNDVAFLTMDLRAKGQHVLGSILLNAYLENTGDYLELRLLRWYEVYRAMVRAKVDSIRWKQADARQRSALRHELLRYLELAEHIAQPEQPGLWITHGFSASGKSTGAIRCVERYSAIRVRSDVERKRLLGKEANFRADGEEASKMYAKSATDATYGRLYEVAEALLRSGYSVVVDATFLLRKQREDFWRLSHEMGASFRILDFQVPYDVLRARIQNRLAAGNDASDADEKVLEWQMANAEPLSPAEKTHVTNTEELS
ncbi:MAG: AAA family ATPase [bacterium]|nr:AAA family ATPase [bacterium]